MINLYIYIESEADAEELVKQLFKEELIAHASINASNKTLIKVGQTISEKECCLIMVQTKALLFNEIVAFIEKQKLKTVKLFSVPITQCDSSFSETIRANTRMI